MHRRSFADLFATCSAKTIYQCPSCSAEIKGDYHVRGMVVWSSETPVPRFCDNCGKGFPWADKINTDPVTKLDPAASVERICKRIPLVIRQLRWRHDNR